MVHPMSCIVFSSWRYCALAEYSICCNANWTHIITHEGDEIHTFPSQYPTPHLSSTELVPNWRGNVLGFLSSAGGCSAAGGTRQGSAVCCGTGDCLNGFRNGFTVTVISQSEDLHVSIRPNQSIVHSCKSNTIDSFQAASLPEEKRTTERASS